MQSAAVSGAHLEACKNGIESIVRVYSGANGKMWLFGSYGKPV